MPFSDHSSRPRETTNTPRRRSFKRSTMMLNPVQKCFNMKCKPVKDNPEVIRMQHEDTDVASPVTDSQENSY
ncbi:hypothetical protein B9Z55_026195 [Caenorhabditis nigoni]|uniref:Uncharacterized protein n=1 Tax=Caenorhabditis nigoni TaxID=1611254 RepID=A0A2G5T286_9PELO|nr:hypothetical protein B9Z55_026195 [Caenorhabditis nigoni]